MINLSLFSVGPPTEKKGKIYALTVPNRLSWQRFCPKEMANFAGTNLLQSKAENEKRERWARGCKKGQPSRKK